MSSPPKPARRVSFIRYSFRRTRRRFSTMIRLSFRLTFASAGISRRLFQDNLEVHGVLVPWTASMRAAAPDRRLGPSSRSCIRPCTRTSSFDPSLQRHELRRSRGADARPAVRDRLARHRELADVVPDHLRPDLDRHEFFPVVHRDLLSDEVGEDRDVAAVRAYGLLGPVLADLLDKREAFLIDAAHERASGPRRQELDDLLEGHRLHLVERVPAVRELLLAPRLAQP